MKKVYHLCHSSKEEVLFRDHEDYIWGFNCYALALHKTGSCSLADAHMSNHRHLIAQTSCPEKLMRLTRLAYTKHFNAKYSRKGPLGEANYFCDEINGLYHLLAALSYVMRNALHHGVAPTPFSYPHCSANVIFAKALGKSNDGLLLNHSFEHRFVGRNVKIPDGYHMNKSGLILREDVTAVQQVELLYTSPRSFLYYMNRLSNENWIEEQKEDNTLDPPITMEFIERGVLLTNAEQMYKNENSRLDYRKLFDIQLCSEIDRMVGNVYKVKSIYCLTYSQKQELFRIVMEMYHVSEAQVVRCLAMNV